MSALYAMMYLQGSGQLVRRRCTSSYACTLFLFQAHGQFDTSAMFCTLTGMDKFLTGFSPPTRTKIAMVIVGFI